MNKLKELRKKQKLYQKDVAKFLDIAISTYSYWESGKFEPDNDSLLKLASFYNVSTDYLLGRNENAPAESKGKWINVYGNIAAGIPIEAIEDVIDQEEISAEMAHHGEYIALRVKGSSMEPRIMDGDVVIIRLQPDIENGEIAAVFVNGNEVTLKQIKRDENGLWLVPLNPAHAPMYYTQKECAELPIRILGKMVELRAKF